MEVASSGERRQVSVSSVKEDLGRCSPTLARKHCRLVGSSPVFHSRNGHIRPLKNTLVNLERVPYHMPGVGSIADEDSPSSMDTLTTYLLRYRAATAHYVSNNFGTRKTRTLLTPKLTLININHHMILRQHMRPQHSDILIF